MKKTNCKSHNLHILLKYITYIVTESSDPFILCDPVHFNHSFSARLTGVCLFKYTFWGTSIDLVSVMIKWFLCYAIILQCEYCNHYDSSISAANEIHQPFRTSGKTAEYFMK